jgi:hypothetical protein
LRGYHGIRELVVVALEALALGAKRKPAAAFPPWRSKPAALAEPQPGQEFFRMHRILIRSLQRVVSILRAAPVSM